MIYKKLIVLIIMFFILSVLSPVLASDLNVYDPNIYVKETPEQQATRLKNTYGLSNYYDCYGGSCSGTCQSSTGYLFGGCGSCIESCLELKQLRGETNDSSECPEGYLRSEANGRCYKETTCQSGYEKVGDSCVKQENTTQCSNDYVSINGSCMLPDIACAMAYGFNSEVATTYNPGVKCLANEGYDIQDENFCCRCKTGYEWNSHQNGCILAEAAPTTNIVGAEKNLVATVDTDLSQRMKGKILLQVEQNGEGWYVNPDDQKKYYLGRPADAFNIMRNLGLGIKHSELTGYLNSKFPGRLSGKIMLDVEQNGEAYYVNPSDLKGYYLNRPADAFSIMRQFGLGITNADIRKINVGEI